MMENRTYHNGTGINIGTVFGLIGIFWAIGAVMFYFMRLDEFLPIDMNTFVDVSWFWCITLFFTGLWVGMVSIECEHSRNIFNTGFDIKWDLPLITIWIISGIGLLQTNFLLMNYPEYPLYVISRRAIPSIIGWIIAINLIPMRKELPKGTKRCLKLGVARILPLFMSMISFTSALYFPIKTELNATNGGMFMVLVALFGFGIVLYILADDKYQQCKDDW